MFVQPGSGLQALWFYSLTLAGPYDPLPLLRLLQFDGRLIPTGQVNRNIGSCDQPIKWATAVLEWGVCPAMEDFAFKVILVAVVRVRADDQGDARTVVPTVLGAPGAVSIRLANENIAATGRHATITDVDFSIRSVKPFDRPK